MRSNVAVSLLVILSACTGTSAVDTTSPLPETTTTVRSAPTSTLPPVVECPGEGDFAEGGGIAEIDSTDADSSILNRISWNTSDRCETFVFDFATSEGAPATTVPDIRVDHLDTFQVIRISMDVDASVVIDQLVETELVDRLYAVRSLDGRMLLDLHLAQPAAVRATTFASPARLRVELRPGFVPFAGQSTVDDQVVVVLPASESDIGTTASISGYARTSDGEVLAVVTQSGSVVAETTTTAADSAETWGEFHLELEVPAGEISVFLGEDAGDNGGLDGLTMDFTATSDPLSR